MIKYSWPFVPRIWPIPRAFFASAAYFAFLMLAAIASGSMFRSDLFFGSFGYIRIASFTIAVQFLVEIAALCSLLCAIVLPFRGLSRALEVSGVLKKFVIFAVVTIAAAKFLSFGYRLDNAYIPFSKAYFEFNKAHILANKKKDNVTHVLFYAMDYGLPYTGYKKMVPTHFYVVDRDSEMEKQSHCVRASYRAEKVTETVFFLALVGEYPDPCLTTEEK